MKAFIDKVFKSKKLKEEAKVTQQATEAMVEAIIEEVKQEIKEEEVKEVFAKPGHYFPDCNCFKCVRWRNQGA